MAMAILSFDNPAFKAFTFYATASVAKMMLMGVLTARQRISRDSFSNPEDLALAKKKKKDVQVVVNDEAVERVRRNHLNDLENIPAFVLLGLFYLHTDPTLSTALWHFRVFLVSRLCHTIAYQFAIPQPARALSFFAGMAVNSSMMGQILMATYGAM